MKDILENQNKLIERSRKRLITVMRDGWNGHSVFAFHVSRDNTLKKIQEIQNIQRKRRINILSVSLLIFFLFFILLYNFNFSVLVLLFLIPLAINVWIIIKYMNEYVPIDYIHEISDISHDMNSTIDYLESNRINFSIFKNDFGIYIYTFERKQDLILMKLFSDK